MRRSLKVLLVLFAVGICATGVQAAQSDCQRWWKEYREALAHTPAVHRIRHARHHLHKAAQKRLAMLVHPHPHPAPKVLPARHRPRPTRSELLHALDLACGELPETEDAELLALDQPASFLPDLSFPKQPVDTLPAVYGPVAAVDTPSYPGTTSAPPTSGGGLPPIFGPGFGPIGGGSPLPPTTPTSPTTPSLPPVPPPITTPESPVPEPGSIAMVLTGVLGAAGTLRRRVRLTNALGK